MAVGLCMVCLAATLGACDVLLDVETPASVDAGFLDRPENIELAVASAIADFECAFSDYIVAGGLIGTELWEGALSTGRWPYDQRSFTETGGAYATATCEAGAPGVYQTLSTARFTADHAVTILERYPDIPSRTELLATAHAYAGYARLLLGEGMCSAAIDGGPELSSQNLFALAEAQFSAALSDGSAEITNMALVGRSRARLNQGNTSEALADALMVPVGFVRNAAFSSESERSSNKVWTYNNRGATVSVENDFHDLSWKGVSDPRVDLVDTGESARDGHTPWWTQQKYAEQDSPIPIARYEEAQLIIAEVEGGATAEAIINALHTAVGLPAFDPTVDGSVSDHILQERQRELFLESHHLYDKIRFGDPFLPAAGKPFQETGPKGGFYGSTTCLPLPLVERDNNPNIP